MISQDIPKSDELAVETGQQSRAAQPDIPKADTVGYFEPHQMAKLAESGRLYVIADSVGDAASGQMAAQYAVKRILRSFYTTDTPDLQTRLLDAIRQANQEIFERNRQHPERRPLATYVTAALIHNNKLFVANVGDGRVYAVWDKDIELLTTPTPEAAEPSASSDNGVAQEAKQNGADNIDNKDGDRQPKQKREPEKTKPAMPLLPEKAKLPNDKSTKSLALTPAPRSSNATPLGLEETIKIDTFSRRLFAGDKVAMCSGGLTGYASEPEIAEAVTLHAPSQAIERLMALAAERGNRGHLALSITKILSIPAAAHASMPMVMPTPPNWSDWETESRSSTRPLSKPVPPVPPIGSNIGTRPMGGGPQRKSKPVEIPLTPARSLPWRTCLLVPIILLVLCGLMFLAGSFLLSSEALASIPFINDATETLRREAEALGILQAEPAVLPAPPLPAETATAAIAQEAPMPPQAVAETPVVAQGNNSPLPTPTSPAAQNPALPATAAATATPALPTPTPTQPLPPTIEVPAGCENKARFVTDVTVEDGTEFPPGRQFEKVWRVRNEGDCPWGGGYTVRFLNSDFFATTEEVPLIEVTGPNETADISVPMIAPDQPGSYRSVWQLYDLAGQAFGPTMYLEIEVVAGAEPPPETDSGAEAVDVAAADTLYDFIGNAADATWLSDSGTYTVQQTPISETLELPDAGGLVAVGIAELRGNTQSERPALLTYPDLASGTIQGIYAVETPLQPTDTLAVEVGFTRLSILSDDGVTFEVVFTPDDGSDPITLLSEGVQYRDSPLATTVPLSDIESGQTGTFTLRVLSGDSTSRDWALWIEARLVRS